MKKMNLNPKMLAITVIAATLFASCEEKFDEVTKTEIVPTSITNQQRSLSFEVGKTINVQTMHLKSAKVDSTIIDPGVNASILITVHVKGATAGTKTYTWNDGITTAYATTNDSTERFLYSTAAKINLIVSYRDNFGTITDTLIMDIRNITVIGGSEAEFKLFSIGQTFADGTDYVIGANMPKLFGTNYLKTDSFSYADDNNNSWYYNQNYKWSKRDSVWYTRTVRIRNGQKVALQFVSSSGKWPISANGGKFAWKSGTNERLAFYGEDGARIVAFQDSALLNPKAYGEDSKVANWLRFSVNSNDTVYVNLRGSSIVSPYLKAQVDPIGNIWTNVVGVIKPGADWIAFTTKGMSSTAGTLVFKVYNNSIAIQNPKPLPNQPTDVFASPAINLK
ncbi:MAG: hypothetical protein MUF50_01715 [Planctomycetes bacterium]|jgi:hypothetical protein|nr:hypothetical protein [Planctomycetota bacterium]